MTTRLITFLCFSDKAGAAISIRPQDIADVTETEVIAVGAHRWEVPKDEAARIRAEWKQHDQLYQRVDGSRLEPDAGRGHSAGQMQLF